MNGVSMCGGRHSAVGLAGVSASLAGLRVSGMAGAASAENNLHSIRQSPLEL